MTGNADGAETGFIGPLAGTFAIQTMVSMAMFGIAVIAPVAAPAIGVKAELIGTFSAIAYGIGMPAGLLTGAFADRFGALRICQLTMVFVFLGVAALALSTPVAALLAALLLGLSYGPVNPASTQILARVTTARLRPLIFSIKQTGMPAGAAIAGAVLPPLILAFGWEIAILTTGVLALIVAIGVQPLRARIDAGRDPDRAIRTGNIADPLKLVWRMPKLRCLMIMGFIYAGAQVAIATFYVIHLTGVVGLSLEAAGLTYTALQASAIAGRLFWGAIAGQLVPGDKVLVGLGLATPVCAVVAGCFDGTWPLWSILLVSILLGVTSHSFNGVFFAEITRHISPSQTGMAAGGIQFATLAGVSIMPLIFGLIVTLTENYLAAYATFAALVLAAAIYAAIALPKGDTPSH